MLKFLEDTARQLANQESILCLGSWERLGGFNSTLKSSSFHVKQLRKINSTSIYSDTTLGHSDLGMKQWEHKGWGAGLYDIHILTGHGQLKSKEKGSFRSCKYYEDKSTEKDRVEEGLLPTGVQQGFQSRWHLI